MYVQDEGREGAVGSGSDREDTKRAWRRRVGLFGGSFDPPHKGHTALAEAAIEEGQLDRLIIMPVFAQPFKIGRKVTDDEHRLAMSRIAFGHIKGAEISSYEMEKEGISYTADTLRHVRETNGDSEIFIVTGTDSFLELELWKRGDEILKEYSVMVSVRPGYMEEELDRTAERYGKTYGTHIVKLESTMPDISSTAIRNAFAQGGSPDLLISKGVAEYIVKNRLYLSDGDKADFLETLRKRAESACTERRFRHVEGVVDTAVRLAEVYGADTYSVTVAALIHDMYRNVSSEALPGLVRSLGLDEKYADNINLAHSKIAAAKAKTELEIEDEDILRAVEFHTTGRPGMSLLEKIIFMADAIEPGRSYPQAEKLRELAFADIDKAVYMSMIGTMEYLAAQGCCVDGDTISAAEYFRHVIEDKDKERKND